MSDTRLFIWYTAMLGFIIFFPIIRKIINPRNSFFSSGLVKNFGTVVVATLIVLYLYDQEYIKDPELQFLNILIIFLYISTGFNSTGYTWKSETLRLLSFDKSILQKIARSFGGSKIEDLDIGHNFIITTPYRLKYRVETFSDPENKKGYFIQTSLSSNLNLIKVIFLASLYIILTAYTTDKENVTFPILGLETNAVLAVLFSMSVALIFIYFEIESAKSIIQSLPSVYTKILQNEALNKLSGGIKLKEVDVKTRAQTILDKRKSNVLQAKKEEVQGKLSSVFGEKETEGLDKKSIERMRLMETVKRILNSTPPWSEVSLSEISQLAKGEENEIEIIIAGLRDLKEVKGIYDIWTKTYYGTSSSHWLITKLLNDLPENSTTFENVKIFPDGGGEFSFKKKDQK